MTTITANRYDNHHHHKPSRSPTVEFLPDGSHRHLLSSREDSKRLLPGLHNILSHWLAESKDDEAHERQREPLVTSPPKDLDPLASFTDKYGSCTDVLHYGSTSSVRLHAKKVSGRGAHSAKTPKQMYAVKVFRHSAPSNLTDSHLLEQRILSHLQGQPNIITLIDCLHDERNDLCFVMEFCAGGDLQNLIVQAGRLDPIESDCFFKQMMRGVEFMHEQGIAHRDLKTENILVTSSGEVKVADFGNAEWVDQQSGCTPRRSRKKKATRRRMSGTIPYTAPEELDGGDDSFLLPQEDESYDARAGDVWAAGLVYVAMRTGHLLWRVACEDEDGGYGEYLRGRREEGFSPIDGLGGTRCRNVIYAMLCPNAHRRITASEVLRSEWIYDVVVCVDHLK
ncbi:hypothetical protein ASPZODRAFT_19904 [Penicilliopsis zonata CBS 506.65]|uniref:Serine/threonine-protein kinase ATG1 n=1 Tax=Penicilliopsis zonata CBS 506.65 TaxID=1073090 RepID=A0A1L9S6Z5_9EURO|nr:hypothetical protein ASPZODRAFT_19904 [Penicilliopsis zonata CBS 506.65]OJJ42922.1 hypothetical protein ASPZODRAFT_19904 [Penicilliopsis zonata CBS 506.65]